MTKSKAEAGKGRTPRNPDVKTPTAAEQSPRTDNTRETIESIIIALILAFLFRAFEAEAFEIPTGSMGPTLLGRNKDVQCPKCGFGFQAGVSFEVDDYGRPLYFERDLLPPGRQNLAGQRVVAETCTCPNCRYTMSVNPYRRVDQLLEVKHPYSYSGDRIWVSKAPYVVADPKRWDVAVFKYPLGANINYIKRLVGLPNETVMLYGGNVYTCPLGQTTYRIERKPPHKVLATLLPVYDNDYELAELRDKGWPARWRPIKAAEGEPGWQSLDGGKVFAVEPRGDQECWLGYRHIPPDFEAWQLMRAGKLPADYPARAQLISDFCGYNTATNQATAPAPEPRSLGLHWVGDLSLSCEVDIQSKHGEFALALVEGGRIMQCRFDVAGGQATLSISQASDFLPTATTPVVGPGKYRLRFANVDDQLLLWVNGKLIEFPQSTAYGQLHNQRPNVEDLTPARIVSRGAKVSVAHLRLDRDIYYIATHRGHFSDYMRNPLLSDDPRDLAQFLSTPQRWSVFDELASAEYPLEEGQYLALGDNSPNSGDSRVWTSEHYVTRDLIIGKAFYVYWPHAWETNPSLPIPFRGRTIRVPFYPNFWEMRLIH